MCTHLLFPPYVGSTTLTSVVVSLIILVDSINAVTGPLSQDCLVLPLPTLPVIEAPMSLPTDHFHVIQMPGLLWLATEVVMLKTIADNDNLGNR